MSAARSFGVPQDHVVREPLKLSHNPCGKRLRVFDDRDGSAAKFFSVVGPGALAPIAKAAGLTVEEVEEGRAVI